MISQKVKHICSIISHKFANTRLYEDVWLQVHSGYFVRGILVTVGEPLCVLESGRIRACYQAGWNLARCAGTQIVQAFKLKVRQDCGVLSSIESVIERSKIFCQFILFFILTFRF